MSETNPGAVAEAKKPVSAGQKIAIVAGIIFVFFLLYLLGGGVQLRRTTAPADANAGGGLTRPVVMPPAPPQEAQREATQASVTVPLEERRFRQPQQPRQPMRAAPIMAFEERGRDGDDQDPERARPGQGGVEDDELGTRLNATKTSPARARRLRNPEMTLTQGTMIPCVRETPVNTQHPGFVRCIVPEDVMSTTGNVVLVDRGTRIVGQQKEGLSQGQNRGYILWTRLETPDHVVVDLASPGTDSLGTSGIQLDVNTNFWARFGGAIMLSFIDSGLQAAALGLSQAANSGDGQSVSFNTIRSGGRSAASTALRSTLNIPPFGTSPQGMPEAVFVARDLDFSSVYDLRRR